MMGTKAKLDGLETDAFSRRARRILKFRRGEKKRAKAKFWRKRRVEERSRKSALEDGNRGLADATPKSNPRGQ